MQLLPQVLWYFMNVVGRFGVAEEGRRRMVVP
jgi:hypothetical protein